MNKKTLSKIAKILKVEGLTQADLATKLKTTQARVSRLLSGKTAMTVDDLAEILNALEISMSVFFRDIEEEVPDLVTVDPQHQPLILKSALHAEIFHRLKHSMTEEQLLAEIGATQHRHVKIIIKEFLDAGILTPSVANKLRLNIPIGGRSVFNIDPTYHDHAVDIYKRTRQPVSQARTLPGRQLDSWLALNGDVLWTEYFSESQIREQKESVIRFVAMVRRQLQLNKSIEQRTKSAPAQVNEKFELRALLISSLPYPQTKE